jgi:hypothetical protein
MFGRMEALGLPGNELEDAAGHVAAFPASRQAASRMRQVLDEGSDAEHLAVAVEASLALTLAVLRVANGNRRRRGTISEVPHALEVLDTGTLKATVASIPEYELLEGSPEWEMFPERLRVHATAVRSVAERVAIAIDGGP